MSRLNLLRKCPIYSIEKIKSERLMVGCMPLWLTHYTYIITPELRPMANAMSFEFGDFVRNGTIAPTAVASPLAKQRPNANPYRSFDVLISE